MASDKSRSPKAAAQKARDRRLAEALRANLKRRKAAAEAGREDETMPDRADDPPRACRPRSRDAP